MMYKTSGERFAHYRRYGGLKDQDRIFTNVYLS